jgi:hypothetical protein
LNLIFYSFSKNFKFRPILNFKLNIYFLLEKDPLFRGYEIELENYNGYVTCLQIISFSNVTSKKLFNLKIKDPSFISQHDKNYTFYMAKISINLVYSCNINNFNQNEYLNNLCHFKLINNKPIKTGIESANSSINILNLKNGAYYFYIISFTIL